MWQPSPAQAAAFGMAQPSFLPFSVTLDELASASKSRHQPWEPWGFTCQSTVLTSTATGTLGLLVCQVSEGGYGEEIRTKA